MQIQTVELPFVRVVDVASGDVIRQFPTVEMLAVAEALDRLHGVLIRAQA
jgi:uncharacterized FlaG/YvyC family protein